MCSLKKGIILLEIAFWRNVLPIAGTSDPLVSFNKHGLVPEKIPQLLATKFTRKLPHHVGRVFTETIIECLDFERKTKDMTAYDQHRYYEKHITEGMAKAVGRV